MTSRVTISLNNNNQLEIFINMDARNELVAALQGLSQADDHLHLSARGFGGDLDLCEVPYRKGDRVICDAKILLRLDEWDEKYFPHVMRQQEMD